VIYRLSGPGQQCASGNGEVLERVGRWTPYGIAAHGVNGRAYKSRGKKRNPCSPGRSARPSTPEPGTGNACGLAAEDGLALIDVDRRNRVRQVSCGGAESGDTASENRDCLGASGYYVAADRQGR